MITGGLGEPSNEARAPLADEAIESAANLPEDHELHILLIDDDEDEFVLVRAALERGLETRYRVEWSGTYEDGIARIRRGGHDAILVDHRLGSGTGLDLIRDAKALGCTRPLILLTGERDPSLDRSAQRAGAADFLVKGKTDPVLMDRTLRYAISHARMAAALTRRGEQITGLEVVSRLLSEDGPTPAACGRLADVLADRFGFPRVSLFFVEGARLRLVASRGYDHPVDYIDRASGIIEHLTRSSQPRLIPNITVDPEHRGPAVGMELSMPLIVAGECVGLLNVASHETDALGEADQKAMLAVADRLGSALSLRREQDQLAARVTRFRALATFAAALSGADSRTPVPQVVADAMRAVVPADLTTVWSVDMSGRFAGRADSGDQRLVGSEREPTPTTKRAIAERAVVVSSAPTEAAVPVLRAGRVIGALAFHRAEPHASFTYLEREALPLIADQVSLALENPATHETDSPEASSPAQAIRGALREAVALSLPAAVDGLTLILVEPTVGPVGAIGERNLATAMDGLVAAAAAEGPGTLLIRGSDRVAVIVQTGAVDGAAAAVARIRERGSVAVPQGGLSIGYATAAGAPDDIGDFIQRAEGALLMAARAGTNMTVAG